MGYPLLTYEQMDDQIGYCFEQLFPYSHVYLEALSLLLKIFIEKHKKC